jgi:IclR family transcriptional regulator, acetate operon repressor
MSLLAEQAKPMVQSAARAVDILQLVARADAQGISANMISEKLNIPRQVVYHLAHTLVGTNMLRKVGRGSYGLGLGAAVVADGFRRQIGTGDFVAAYAEKASKVTGETAYVVGWLDDEIVVLGSARGSGAIQAAEIPRGTAGDAHARASGKLLLAMADEDALQRYLADRPLRRRTANTITTKKGLADELSAIRTQWFAAEREEYEPGLSCMAVPIGRVPSNMVLGISTPSGRLEQNFDRYLADLRRVADEIS